MEQAGKAKIQDRIDRSVQIGQHRQERIDRQEQLESRKAGSGKVNDTIGTLLCRPRWVYLCKIKVQYYTVYYIV